MGDRAVSQFLSALRVELVDEQAGIWKLDAPLVYESDLLGRTITVPAGFATDFASVPRIPVVYLAAGGKGERAAVAHDWAYSAQFCDRQTADRLLREALRATGYSAALAGLFYAAVRAFGASHWTAPNVPQPDHVQAAMSAAAS